MKQIFIFETNFTVNMKYAIEAKSEKNALKIFKKVDCEEFFQVHKNEVIVNITPVSEDEYIELFDQQQDYLKDWSRKSKLNLINRDAQD